VSDDLGDLLEGLDGDAREARRRLIDDLTADGASAEEIRQAVAEDRLALLPVERVLRAGAKHSLADLAREAGVDAAVLRRTYGALGVPVGGDDEVRYGDEDVAVTRNLKTLLDAGFTVEALVALNRVVGRAMVQVAASSRRMFVDQVLGEGSDERQLGLAAAGAARELVPQMTALLEMAYGAHLREILSSDVIGIADIAAGRTPGARDMTVAFADLVGFTRLGEEIPAEDLGDVVSTLEELTASLVAKPVTFVKTIGDAVMLVAPTPDPIIDVALELIEADLPQRLRVGIACGPTLERGGDFYGSPVNQASRVTSVARAGSVLVTESVHEHAEGDWQWSFARERKLKGVGEVKLFRARRPSDAEG
jgi:adenylate cyclase